MKKRIVALILTVVMSLLALTSCGSFDFAEENLDAYGSFKYDEFMAALDKIEINWAGESEEGETAIMEVYKNSNFAFRFAVDAELMNLDGVESRGIKITAGGNDVYYEAGAGSWTVVLDENGDEFCCITVELGDIINDLAKLDTVFTMQAYVVVDGVKYVAETEKAYSVVDIIAYYCDNLGIEEVTHLYDYLANNNLI